MGAFHCPIGVAFYDAEGCILCGLCIAKSREEMVAASGKMRAYLRSLPERKGSFKKIVVCGKGGAGKSTLVTLMAQVLREKDYGVLVIDTDESNPGLYRMFGFEQQPRPLMSLMSRFADGEPEAGTEWFDRDEITFYDIPPEYVLDDEGLKFMMVGKITDPFQGCACTMGDITRDLMGKLVPGEKAVVIVDTEAGVESFGRGVEQYADAVLAVVEPSFESIALAEKISYMADGIGVGTVRAVLNKIPSEEIRKKVVEGLALRNVSQAGAVHLDKEVSAAGLDGRPPGKSAAREEIALILERLMAEAAVENAGAR